MSYQFLTTKPRRRVLSVTHKEYLWCLCKANITGPVRLYCKIGYTDGTSDTVLIHTLTAGTLSASQVKVLDVSYDVLAADANGAKVVKQLTVALTNTSMESAADYLVYEPVAFSGDQVRAFYYHNGQGGVDSLITEGEVTSSQKSPFELLRLRNSLKSELSVLARPEEQVFTVKLSPRTPAGEVQALRDLIMIRSVYERVPVTGGYKYLPVIVLNEEMSYGSTEDAVVPLTLTFKYAIDDTSWKRMAVANGRAQI